ncbi:MAG: DUF3795 domain-containing protein [Oscillospiraceae bacterium]|nr:DUF3795 domain-containing protein [Oscillospiraceae bacterium]
MNEARRGSCVILLNGPSSSGKSSIAAVLTDELSRLGICPVTISVDDYMKISTDEEIWEDDVFETVPEMCRDIALALDEGKTVIIDHVITSKRIFDAVMDSAGGRTVKTVLIKCSAGTLRQREAERGDRFIGSAEASLKYLYPKDGYDLTVDTDMMTAGECAAEIRGTFFCKRYREVKKMRDLIAYCGLDCEACNARIATLNNDDELRAETAKLWSELNGAEITPKMINCEGCRVGEIKYPFCSSMCEIRKCAMEKQFETCGSCPYMETCEKLAMITSNDEGALKNLRS